jgi:hypothetical protein
MNVAPTYDWNPNARYRGAARTPMTDYYSYDGFDEMENAMAKLEARMGKNGAKNGQSFPLGVPDFHAVVQIDAASD